MSEFDEPPEDFEDAPTEAHLGTIEGDPNTETASMTALGWDDAVTENPQVGDTEVWEFYNATGDAHPMHIHEVLFQVVDRQDVVIDEESGTVRVDDSAEPTGAVGEQVEGYRDRLPRPGNQTADAIHERRAVRLAPPHRRARG